MLRKLFIIAALALTIAAATPAPAPAGLVCNCFSCDGGPIIPCKDPMTGSPTTCANWWAVYQSHC